VRITAAGKVKVLDFGIAKALSLSRKVTRNDFGSVAYLSPERLETGHVDDHADFWALGVLLHEMLSGAPPFQASDTRRLEQQIVSRQPPPSLASRCPASLEAIVCKMLAPQSAQRYASAQLIREDLERFQTAEPTRAATEGWPQRAAAGDATRRTTPVPAVAAPAEDEKTRRTRPPAAAGSTPPIQPVPVSPVAPPTPAAAPRAGAGPQARRRRRMPRALRFALLVLGLGMAMNEVSVTSAANRLAEGLSGRELEQLGEAWEEFDDLSKRSYFGIATGELERSLVERTSAVAGRVIANYRTPAPSVRENQWRHARDLLARAVAAEPRNNQLRAALRYCDGHLHRINGEARKARRELSEARRELTDAVAAFREAAELRPGWPDPFLGLMRTFIYGLEDVDRGVDALKQAEREGYTANERETAQLGDGYRTRGNTLFRNARELVGMPQEREYLTRAAEAYRQALELYTKASNFTNVTSSIRLAQRSLSQVERRLDELSLSPTEELVRWP
jgi:tetratricopeptide (TPR) repeat protein